MMKKSLISIFDLRKKLLFSSLVGTFLIFQSCKEDSSPRIKDATIQTILESTKGVITELEEIEPGDEYLIIDETIIADKEKSLAVVHYLDGRSDTLSLQDMKSESGNQSNSAIGRVLVRSLAASYFNGNLNNTSPNQGFYKNEAAYNKSTGLKNDLTSTAISRSVSVPGNASTGYGSGKSFRSHGG
jgi:hypothetical protein